MFDVVIVGGGPAGSATGCFLAREGVRVAIVDQAAFPRDKACGDLLCRVSIEVLEGMGLSEFLARSTRHTSWPAKQELPNGKVLPFTIRTVVDGERRWTSVPRRELDAALLAHAQAAGATVIERAKVLDMAVENGGVRLTAAGIQPAALEARLAIVAQGSTGRFCRRKPDFFAIRGYYAGRPDEKLIIHWMRNLSPGYGWQFPLPESGLYNVGLGSTWSLFRQHRLADALPRLAFAGDKQAVGPPRGGALNTSFGAAPLHDERTLWVGDAAGLVQPHNGEGISGALRSGRLAAEVALEALASGRMTAGALATYTRRLHREMGAEFRRARVMAWIIRHPRLFAAVGSFLLSHFSLTAQEISEALDRERPSSSETA